MKPKLFFFFSIILIIGLDDQGHSLRTTLKCINDGRLLIEMKEKWDNSSNIIYWSNGLNPKNKGYLLLRWTLEFRQKVYLLIRIWLTHSNIRIIVTLFWIFFSSIYIGQSPCSANMSVFFQFYLHSHFISRLKKERFG